MAAPGAAGPAGFEVHLPQSVGVRVLKALEGARLAGPLRRIQGVVPPQDRGDGGGRGQRLDALAGQQHPQLARAPGGVLGAQRQHRLLQGRRRPRGTPVRAPRAVLQAVRPLRGVAPQPLVAGGRRDPKALAQRPPVGPRLPRQGHKLSPQVTHASLRKWHIWVLRLTTGCVNHVSGLHTRRGRGPGHARPPIAPALALAALHAWGGAALVSERGISQLLTGRAVVLIATGRPVGRHAWGLPAWGGRVGIRAAADLRVRFADAVAAVSGRIQRLVTGSGGPTSRARALVTAFH